MPRTELGWSVGDLEIMLGLCHHTQRLDPGAATAEKAQSKDVEN